MTGPVIVGTLTWHPAGSIKAQAWPHRGNVRPVWGITALPHVMMRLKRVFPRVEVSSKGTMYLADTIETAREIEWVTGMFPLAMDADVAARLTLGASQYRVREQAINDILGGKVGQVPALLGTPGMTPRDYQTQYVDLLAEVQRLLLGDGTGVGKTITAALGFALPGALPALVAMPTHLPPQWAAKIGQLWPMLTTHTLKGTRPYDLADIRAHKGHYPDVLLAPYSRIAGWSEALAGQVHTVVFDEVQELRRGRESEKGKGAARLSEAATYVTGASATPAHNYGAEFFNVLDIINPGALGTRGEFLREWASYGYAREGKERINDPAAFGTYLRSAGLMLARSRKDVGIELGRDPVVEIEYVGTDPKALAAVDADVAQIAQMILSSATSNQDKFVMGGQLDWKLRQATGVAKAPAVAEYVRLLLESEDKVVLFGWHRACFAPGTEALMFDGSVRSIETIEVGEQVMGPDSLPRTVKELISGSGKLYRIVPNKGQPWVCSENHVLTVWNSQARRYEKWTAAEFAGRSERWQRDRALYRAATTDFSGGISVAEPWLVGYWLGDGATHLRTLQVASSDADPEVEVEIRAIAERHNLSVSKWRSRGAAGSQLGVTLSFSSGLTGPKTRNALVRYFRSLGLAGNKHIPQSYLTAPVEDRLDLLAGLIDSDGHVYRGNGVGSANYCTIIKRLAYDVAFLSRSLGLAAYVTATTHGKSGYKPSGGAVYNVTISGDLTRIPTRIARKRAGMRAGQKDVLHTGFRIEAAGVGDYYGFEVDQDHLFLLSDFTVVHNCFDIWLERLRDFNPVMFTGSESPAQKETSRLSFMKPDGEFGSSRVLIVSLASGAGMDGLQDVCSAVVFGELDWSPKVHSQGIDRIDRPGQLSPVLVVYLVSEDGSDPVIAEVLDLKAQNTDPIMSPDAALFEMRPGSTPGDDGKSRMRALAEAWAAKNAPHLLTAKDAA